MFEFLTDSIVVGDIAPDIAQPDSLGTIHRLSDLRGQWVLLDFWASWCGDCRREMPTVKAISQQYPSLKIYAVSLDKDRKAWTNAIKRYEQDWISVSEVKGWPRDASPYGIKWIPTTFLIDPDGKVVSVTLNENDLQQAVDKYLTQK
jgi:thiol-disulfide isomerase/thioredoxin